MGRRILNLPVVYLWRLVLGGGTQLRRPASPLCLVLFLVGFPHGVGWLERGGTSEERCEPRISSLI